MKAHEGMKGQAQLHQSPTNLDTDPGTAPGREGRLPDTSRIREHPNRLPCCNGSSQHRCRLKAWFPWEQTDGTHRLQMCYLLEKSPLSHAARCRHAHDGWWDPVPCWQQKGPTWTAPVPAEGRKPLAELRGSDGIDADDGGA
jgi:hypothetical protein